MMRNISRAESCQATKEELIDAGLNVLQDCLSCQDANIICRVSHHPGKNSITSIKIWTLIRHSCRIAAEHNEKAEINECQRSVTI